MRTWIVVAAVVLAGCQAKAPEMTAFTNDSAAFDDLVSTAWALESDWQSLFNSRAVMDPKQDAAIISQLSSQMDVVEKKIDLVVSSIRKEIPNQSKAPDWSTDIALSAATVATLEKCANEIQQSLDEFDENQRALAESNAELDKITGASKTFDGQMNRFDSKMAADQIRNNMVTSQMRNSLELNRERGRLRLLKKLQGVE